MSLLSKAATEDLFLNICFRAPFGLENLSCFPEFPEIALLEITICFLEKSELYLKSSFLEILTCFQLNFMIIIKLKLRFLEISTCFLGFSKVNFWIQITFPGNFDLFPKFFPGKCVNHKSPFLEILTCFVGLVGFSCVTINDINTSRPKNQWIKIM